MTEIKKMGRPSKGVRRSVALTIPKEPLSTLDIYLTACGLTMADYLRELVVRDIEDFESLRGGVLGELVSRKATENKR